MSSLFGGKTKGPDAATLRAQRRQEQSISSATADESRALGARRRAMNARRGQGETYGATGAAGVKATLGG